LTVDGELWQRLSPRLDEALQMDPRAREAWLAELDATEPDIAQGLRELLDLHAAVEGSGFLERSLLESDDALIGQKVGAYTVECMLGRGGMGSVWLGRRSDDKFEGRAAIKLFERRGLGTPPALARIRHEASLLARLSHAHIARLFDAGVRENGQPYLILEYVEGVSIDRYCRERSLSLKRRLLLFLDVLDAVSYAQGQLIVHGDLKPSNVLVTDEGSVKLVDFGVATLRADPQTAPVGDAPPGPRALTPGYAPPEQVRGEPLSAAADVYALGILLHLLVTGRHPFGTDTSTSTQLVRSALTDDPAGASTQLTDAAERRRVRGDLDAVIGRSLDRLPERRYPTAAEFAADVRRFLGNFPVSARPASRVHAVRKFAQRHSGGVLSAVLTLIVLVAAVVITSVQMVQARQRLRAATARARGIVQRAHELRVDGCGAGREVVHRQRTARACGARPRAPEHERCGSSRTAHLHRGSIRFAG
jgi:serine/threonine-protein kinase